ncbi:hypothetical protein EYF80_016372 [Liparis tanakae]|uniref:Uncharacterized protein n=1 Tax=Liparis tanakae TaxID=230148 RepID=A0A4Z2I654_9TELE|nr:hypothetical protein EYF80_016372 [Liparis tanakae]
MAETEPPDWAAVSSDSLAEWRLLCRDQCHIYSDVSVAGDQNRSIRRASEPKQKRREEKAEEDSNTGNNDQDDPRRPRQEKRTPSKDLLTPHPSPPELSFPKVPSLWPSQPTCTSHNTLELESHRVTLAES